jgi:hypothetical protein
MHKVAYKEERQKRKRAEREAQQLEHEWIVAEIERRQQAAAMHKFM